MIQRGANINHRMKCVSWTQTVLQIIASRPDDAGDMVDFLLNAGANVNEADYYVEEAAEDASSSSYFSNLPSCGPPLQVTALYGNLQVVKLLIANGARIDFARCELGSPLEAAARGNNEGIMFFLLPKDVNINAKADVNNGCGYYGCALSAAISENHNEIGRSRCPSELNQIMFIQTSAILTWIGCLFCKERRNVIASAKDGSVVLR
jgi:ankyrin repeat protein